MANSDSQADFKSEKYDIENEPEQTKKRIKKSTLFLAVFLVLLVIITILSSQYPNFGENFSVANWFDSSNYDSVSFWAAVGFTILACFLGALIPFPVPYALPVTIFSSVWFGLFATPKAWSMIFGLIFFATFGNTVGDFVDYVIGEGAEYVVRKDDPEMKTRWSKIILQKPHLIPWIIALFGISPLPDSVLLVPLGFVKYDKKKTLLWMFVGKFFMMLLYAMAGIYTVDWILALVDSTGDENGWITGVVLLYFIWFIMAFMLNYKPKSTRNKK